MIDPALGKMKTIITLFRESFWDKPTPVPDDVPGVWNEEVFYHTQASMGLREDNSLSLVRRGLTWVSLKVTITGPVGDCHYKRYIIIDELLDGLPTIIDDIKKILACPCFPPFCPKSWDIQMDTPHKTDKLRLAFPEEILTEEEKGIQKTLDWLQQLILAAGYVKRPDRRNFVADKGDSRIFISRCSYLSFELSVSSTKRKSTRKFDIHKRLSLMELIALTFSPNFVY